MHSHQTDNPVYSKLDEVLVLDRLQVFWITYSKIISQTLYIARLVQIQGLQTKFWTDPNVSRSQKAKI